MGQRRFEYTDARSHKFWSIRLDGCSYTVQYGRIGTVGQTQCKQFGTEAEAQRSYEKLIDEKLRKGYVEVTAGDGSGAVPSPSSPPPATGMTGSAAIATPVTAAVEEPKRPESGATPETRSVATHAPEALEVTRTLRLDPVDWFWATWRPLVPLPRPAAVPFNRDEALSRLSRVTGEKYGWRWHWEKAAIAPSLTREEAHFWFGAMTFVGSNMTIRDRVNYMAKQQCSGEISLDEMRKEIGAVLPWISPEIMLTLANLFSLGELFELMLKLDEIPQPNSRYYLSTGTPVAALVDGFRQYILPYLTEPEKELLRERLRPLLDPALWPTQPSTAPPPQFHLAACLGLHAPLRTLVESWEDDRYCKEGWSNFHGEQPQEIVFGLEDPRFVDLHMRRLRLPLLAPEWIRAWLAHTGYEALDWPAGSVLMADNREQATRLLETLALAEAPENAPLMLQLMLESKAPRVARQWLEAHPQHAIAGLIPVAAGRGRLAEAAADLLCSLKRKGFEPVLRSRLESEPAEIAERVWAAVRDAPEERFAPFDEQTTPEWLHAAASDPGGLKRAKRPTWVDVADLPPLITGQYRLNEPQVEAVLFALQSSGLAEADAFLKKLKEGADRASLDAFLWRLFEQWLTEGAPAKENWAMKALGLLGSDAIALTLTPLIRHWPGEGQHQRAVLGLGCLRAIGTDTALMQINGIAQKIKFKGLKAKALECMEAIAKERGFTRAELEDRIIPDCDLDERGSRIFDFGPRQFRMVLGPDLKPVIREEHGKLRPDLPKPTSKDDAERAAAAVAEWKLLKKQVAEAVKIQAVRLEQAMVTGRRWPRGAFETLLVRHPLMTHLVRRLVWGGYDPTGTLVVTFRVTEDATCADVNDEAFDLTGIAEVGILHPLHMAPEQRSAWGELLSDYEIVPPFPQLGRPIYRLEPGEGEKTEITRFAHIKIPAVSLVGTLERLGWTRAIPEDHGWFYEHSKPFYGSDAAAVVQYEGVMVGEIVTSDDQRIEHCFFVPGIYTPIAYHEHKERVPLGQIDPVAISEVLNDLTTVAAKGS